MDRILVSSADRRMRSRSEEVEQHMEHMGAVSADRRVRSGSEEVEQHVGHVGAVSSADRRMRSRSEEVEQHVEHMGAVSSTDRRVRSRSEEVEQQMGYADALAISSSSSSRFSTSLQDLVQLSSLTRSTSQSVQDLRHHALTVKQQKIRRTCSIQAAIRRATSQTELHLSTGPGMDYCTPYRNRGLVFRGGKAYRTYEYQFLSKKQKISLGRRQPVSTAILSIKLFWGDTLGTLVPFLNF